MLQLISTKPGRNLGWVKAHPRLPTLRRTGWIRGAQKPFRAGVYEREFSQGLIMYSRWTGKYWCTGDEIFSRAAWKTEPSSHQVRPWRGYAKKACYAA